MKVLITGNRGFVGSETQKLFEENGIEVQGYDLMDRWDVRDPQQLETAVQGVDRILHLAAIARFSDADKDPMLAHETNANGTRNVAMVAAKYHIPVVFASTGSVYMPIKRDPPITEDFEVCGNSVYGCTKAIGERYIQKLCNPWIILRYAHLYGKEKRHHGLVGGVLARAFRGLAPKIYGGNQSNDFCYIKDIAKANLLAVTASWDKWNQIYNIGSGEELTADKATEIIVKIFGFKDQEIERHPAREVDPPRFVYNTKKAEETLGFKAEYNFWKGMFCLAEEMGYNVRDGIQKQGKTSSIQPRISKGVRSKESRKDKEVAQDKL